MDIPESVKVANERSAKRKKATRPKRNEWVNVPDEEVIEKVSARTLRADLERCSVMRLNNLVERLATFVKEERPTSRLRADCTEWIKAVHKRIGAKKFNEVIQ